jgi:hypothetical protein
VLVVVFSVAALKSAASLYDGEDYAWMSSIGIGIVSYLISIPVLIGEGATAYLLFKQKAAGYAVGSYVILAEALDGLFGVGTLALNPEKAKAAYVAHRAARGLATSQDAAQSITSVQTLALMAAGYLGVWAVVYYYLRRVKPELTR